MENDLTRVSGITGIRTVLVYIETRRFLVRSRMPRRSLYYLRAVLRPTPTPPRRLLTSWLVGVKVKSQSEIEKTE
jgi:hypothetical protein